MKGERFLQQLGSPEDLKILLGDRYDAIVTTLQSAKRKDAPSADVPSGPGSSITVSGGPGPNKKRKVVAWGLIFICTYLSLWGSQHPIVYVE